MPEKSGGPGAGTARSRGRRRWIITAAIVLGTVILLFLLRAPILAGFARFLIVDDALQPADAIVVLNGGIDTRPAAAAALYARGLAPIVVIAREEESRATKLRLMPNRTDVAIELLRHDGVPLSAIRQLRIAGGSTSTADEARAFASYARLHDFGRIIVVTSDYHTRRTRRTFRLALRPLGIEVSAAAARSIDFDPAEWWRSEDGLLAIFQEYVKLVRDVLTD